MFNQVLCQLVQRIRTTVLNCKTGECIYNQMISKDLIAPVYEAAKEAKVGILVYTDNLVLFDIKMLHQLFNCDSLVNELRQQFYIMRVGADILSATLSEAGPLLVLGKFSVCGGAPTKNAKEL